VVVVKKWVSMKKCSNCQGGSEAETFCGAHGLMRCPECNVFEGWDVNAASNLATRAKHELEGKPAPAYRSQAESKGQRQKK
jgi:transposase